MIAPKEVTSLLDDYTRNNRWGTIELTFKNGCLVFVTKKETLVSTEDEPGQRPVRYYGGSDHADRK